MMETCNQKIQLFKINQMHNKIYNKKMINNNNNNNQLK